MQQERKIPSLVLWTGGDKASNADFILRRSRHHNPLNPLNPLNLLNPGPHSGPYSLKYLFARFQAKPKDFWKSHRYRAFWG